MRELTRQRFYLVDCVSDAKRKAISFIDKIFPEYQNAFSDTFGTTSVELLQTYTSPDVIADLDTELFSSFLKSVSRGRFGKDKAQELQSIARNSFGSFLFVDSASLAIRQFIQQIKLLEEQIKELDNFIEEKFSTFDTQLTSIIGVGTTLAASFLAEIGDINRFDSPEKLAAFAGIDPSVKQSGEFNGTRCRMSKRGSPYLREPFGSLPFLVSVLTLHLKLFTIKNVLKANPKLLLSPLLCANFAISSTLYLNLTYPIKSSCLSDFLSLIQLTFHSWSSYNIVT